MRFGAPELFLILLIVIVIFGIGRVTKIGSELGNAIRQFREGLQGNKDEKKDPPDDTPPASS